MSWLLSKNRITRIVEAILLCLIAAYVFAGKDIAPFCGDESTYISLSRDYTYLVKQGKVARILYHPKGRTQEQDFRKTTGTINIYTIGLARDLAGMDASAVNGPWIWGYPPDQPDVEWNDNAKKGRLPEPSTLRIARIPSTLMAALAMVIFFLAVLQLQNSRAAAWAATLLLATHPLFLVYTRRAMQEGSKILFVCMSLYFAARVLKQLKNGRSGKWQFCLLGLASGFTLASKQDVAMVLFAIYLALLIAPLFYEQKRKRFLENLAYVASSSCISFVVFFALMPVWWGWWANIVLLTCGAIFFFLIPNVIAGKSAYAMAAVPILILVALTAFSPGVWPESITPIQIMMKARDRVVEWQVAYCEKYSTLYLPVFKDRASFLAWTLFTAHVYYNPAGFDGGPVKQQQAAYEASFLSGRHDLAALDIMIVGFFLLGLWKTARQPDPENVMIQLVFWITAGVLVAATPLAYDRYFLALQIPYTLLAGIGIGMCWTWLLQHYRARNLAATRNAG